MSTQELASSLASLSVLPTVTDAPSPTPELAFDFTSVLPGHPVVTVVVRTDRLRGTTWDKRAEAILAPMPDYRTLVRNPDDSFFDHYDLLIISSPEPRNVTATTVAVRARAPTAAPALDAGPPPEPDATAYVSSSGARIDWSAHPRGRVGTRAPADRPHPDDPRVFFSPTPSWLLLVRPELVTDDAPWPDQLPAFRDATGTDDGPILAVTVRGFPRTLALPRVGSLPAPERATLSMRMVERGFTLHASLAFADEARAAQFERRFHAIRNEVLDSFAGERLLRGFNAYNAVAGLRVHRDGALVTFATSISIADGRALIDLAAEQTARFFEQLRARAAEAEAEARDGAQP